jgi:hypothetical protein
MAAPVGCNGLFGSGLHVLPVSEGDALPLAAQPLCHNIVLAPVNIALTLGAMADARIASWFQGRPALGALQSEVMGAIGYGRLMPGQIPFLDCLL